MKVYVNGKYRDEGDAMISVFDHGLLYGDGIFEGIRAYMGGYSSSRNTSIGCSARRKAILLNIPMSHADMMRAGGGDVPSQ
jgi:branched-chain amino acid aminotransferase